MEIHRTSFLGVPLLRIEGNVGHSAVAALDEALRGVVDKDSRLLLDLGGCLYLDSGALAVLLTAARFTRPSGWIALIGFNNNVYRLLEVVGLTAHPNVLLFDDLRSACETLATDQGDSASGPIAPFSTLCAKPDSAE